MSLAPPSLPPAGRPPSRRRGAAWRILPLPVLALAAVAAWLALGQGGSSRAAHGTVAASAAPTRAVIAPARAPVRTIRTRTHLPAVADPEAAQSFPDPTAAANHAAAITPAQAISDIAPGAPSDAEVARELAQLQRLQQGQRRDARGGAVDATGQAQAPAGAPAAIARVIAGGDAIADFPYVYGGGHASFIDTAYDCSGSVSYALAAGGFLTAPLVSGDFMGWGAPGPGRWISIYANPGHMWMVVAGLRFDTSGRSGPLGSRWSTNSRGTAGFVVRHPPGF